MCPETHKLSIWCLLLREIFLAFRFYCLKYRVLLMITCFDSQYRTPSIAHFFTLQYRAMLYPSSINLLTWETRYSIVDLCGPLGLTWYCIHLICCNYVGFYPPFFHHLNGTQTVTNLPLNPFLNLRMIGYHISSIDGSKSIYCTQSTIL